MTGFPNHPPTMDTTMSDGAKGSVQTNVRLSEEGRARLDRLSDHLTEATARIGRVELSTRRVSHVEVIETALKLLETELGLTES
jgi:predicted DNA-binding protein